MRTMIDPAGLDGEACETELPPAARRCLRHCASEDHQQARKLHCRSEDTRRGSHRRAVRLHTVGSHIEARAADLARESR